MKRTLLFFITLLFSIALHAQTVEGYLKSAIEKQNSGDNDGAIADCNKALNIEPNNAIICNVRGLSRYNLGLYDAAIDDYSATIRSYPTNAIAYNYRGSSRYYLGQYKEAIKDFTEAIKLYSKYSSAYSNRGNAKNSLGLYNEAIADFSEAINIDPNNAGAYNNRGYIRNRLGKYNEALADCNKALSLDPKVAAGAYRNKGNAEIGLGRYEEGIADCSKAIALDLQNAKAYNYRGYAYYKLGKYELAIKDDDSATEFKEDDYKSFWEYRDDAETKLIKQGGSIPTTQPVANNIPYTNTPVKTNTVAVVPAKTVPAPVTNSTPVTNNQQVAINTTPKPVPANTAPPIVAAAAVAAPPETTNSYVNLIWSKPVDDITTLPDGILRLVESNEVNVKIKAISNVPLDKSKFHMFVNGQDFSNGNKMTVADIEELKHRANTYQYNYTATVKVGMDKSVIKLTYDNTTSEELTVTYTPMDINLHVLAIGTSGQGLKYPTTDATDFANLFAGQKGEHKLFHDVSTELLLADQAKAVNMADKIAEWSSKQYNERDVLMLFISSHGFAEDGKLLITGTDYKATSKKFTTIDFKEQVLDPLEGVNCKKFIFIDACNSGAGITEGGKAATQDVANEISKMANSGNSTTIISSSSSSEQSWEDDSWGNGAFTKAIKEALQDMKADTDQNGLITMNELYDYIKARVAELIKQAGKKDLNGNAVTQTPHMYNPRGNVSIYLK